MTPIKAIRAKCLDCCCGQANEVKLCPTTGCSLYPFRFGHNPNIKREVTEKQKQASRERMTQMRAGKKNVSATTEANS